MDGAGLGQALSAEFNDLSLEDIALYIDAFYLPQSPWGQRALSPKPWKKRLKSCHDFA